MTWASLGKPLGELGRRRAASKPKQPRSRLVKFKYRSASYEVIKQEVLAAIAQLSAVERAQIPPNGTLPEIMAALGMLWAKIPFQAQISYSGGRMALGGAVVDYKVQYGGVVIVRVMGDYWHSLSGRKMKDITQWNRLHGYGYKVADVWESDLYRVWREGRLADFMREAVMGAQ